MSDTAFLLSLLFGLGLALLGGLWLALSLRRQNLNLENERHRLNARALREELANVRRQHAAGDIDDEQSQTRQEQIQRSAEHELQRDAPLQQAPWSRTQAATLALATVVISAAFFWLSDGLQHRPQAEDLQAQQEPATLDEMVAKLEARLEQQPDDLRGWLMLGRSRVVMNQYSAAADAFARANELTGGQNANILVAEAEAIGLAQGQNLQGRPQQLIDQALSLESTNPRALWYALLAAQQRGELGKVAEFKDRLAAVEDLPQNLREVLAAEFGMSFASKGASESPDQLSPQLQVQIELSPKASAAISKDDTLFVFAKAVSGPAAPLAVWRESVGAGDWPRTVTLSDELSMRPDLKMSGFNEWEVTARLSRSGQAQAQSGDWYASQTVSRGARNSVKLIIDTVIP